MLDVLRYNFIPEQWWKEISCIVWVVLKRGDPSTKTKKDYIPK